MIEVVGEETVVGVGSGNRNGNAVTPSEEDAMLRLSSSSKSGTR